MREYVMRIVHLTVATLSLFGLVVSCSDSPTAPRDTFADLTERLETDHFIFHYEPGDFVEAERSEAFARWAIAYLGVTCPKKIDYYKSKEWEDQQAVSGSGGRARMKEFEVWTRWSYHPHECTHLYASRIGVPTSFFLEGIAVALQFDPFDNDFTSWDWRAGMPTHDVIRSHKAEGLLVPLESIIDSESFWASNDVLLCYRESGSFSGYLIDTYGIERYKRLYAVVEYEDARQVILEKFCAVYGLSLQQAEEGWHAFLDHGN
jgi:hypothetical protein